MIEVVRTSKSLESPAVYAAPVILTLNAGIQNRLSDPECAISGQPPVGRNDTTIQTSNRRDSSLLRHESSLQSTDSPADRVLSRTPVEPKISADDTGKKSTAPTIQTPGRFWEDYKRSLMDAFRFPGPSEPGPDDGGDLHDKVKKSVNNPTTTPAKAVREQSTTKKGHAVRKSVRTKRRDRATNRSSSQLDEGNRSLSDTYGLEILSDAALCVESKEPTRRSETRLY
jgi:hypothetical protein